MEGRSLSPYDLLFRLRSLTFLHFLAQATAAWVRNSPSVNPATAAWAVPREATSTNGPDRTARHQPFSAGPGGLDPNARGGATAPPIGGHMAHEPPTHAPIGAPNVSAVRSQGDATPSVSNNINGHGAGFSTAPPDVGRGGVAGVGGGAQAASLRESGGADGGALPLAVSLSGRESEGSEVGVKALVASFEKGRQDASPAVSPSRKGEGLADRGVREGSAVSTFSVQHRGIDRDAPG
jgi:hypothetical protein